MHGKHEPSCTFCGKFVLPFDEDGPLADWGYCKEEVKGDELTQEQLKAVEEEVGKGDYSFLSKDNIPFYQGLDEGCDKFEDEGHH